MLTYLQTVLLANSCYMTSCQWWHWFCIKWWTMMVKNGQQMSFA